MRKVKNNEAYPDDDSHLHTGINDHVSYSYDAAQRMNTKVDQIPNTLAMVYNMADWLTQRTYPDTNNDTFTYDLASRLLTASSARYGNTITRTYDAAGRLTADNLTVGTSTWNVGFGFDNANRNTALTYPDGSAVARGYTARNQLSEVDYTPNGGAASTAATRTYDVGMRLATTTYGNSLVETRTYRSDASGKDNMLSSLVIPSVTNFTYTFDANKNKTAETDGVLANYTWTTGTGGYDDKDRLINWARTNGDSQTWSLSLVGNWASTVVNGTTDTRTHSAVHELLTRSTSTTAMVYDAKGNLTTNSNGQTYSWDFDNKMSQAVNGATTATYAYDALGRRTSKTIGANTTLYVSALQQEIAEYANSTLNVKYTFGDYVDEPLLLINVTGTTETKYYYHANSLYCIAAMTDAAGAVQERYVYSPYGKVTILDGAGTTVRASTTVGNAILYTGRRYEPETGLYYFRARYYDGDGGRFMGRDSYVYQTSMNLYDYAKVAPTLSLDPTGNVVQVIEASSESGWAVLPLVDKTASMIPHLEEAVEKYLHLMKNWGDQKKYAQYQSHDGIRINGKPYKGTYQEFIDLISREKNSRYLVQKSGGLGWLMVAEKALLKNNKYEWDRTGIAIHGLYDPDIMEPTGDVSINGEIMKQQAALAKLREIANTVAVGRSDIASCFQSGVQEESFKIEAMYVHVETKKEPSQCFVNFVPSHLTYDQKAAGLRPVTQPGGE